MECWNLGMMGLKKPVFKTHLISMIFLFDGVFQRKKPENRCLASIIKKSSFNISCRIARFPLFMPNIPSFHKAYQENGRKKYCYSLRGVGSMRCGLYEPEANKL